MKYPSFKEARKILHKHVKIAGILEHCENTMLVAGQIAKQTGANVCIVKAAALLHDIGRCKYNIKNGNNDDRGLHAYEGYKMLGKTGFEDVFCRIVLCHNIFGITKKEAEILGYPKPLDMVPRTLEEKIVSVADMVRGDVFCAEDIIRKLKTVLKEKAEKRYGKFWKTLRPRTCKRAKQMFFELERKGMDLKKVKQPKY